MFARKARLHDDHEAFDREFWARVSPNERVAAALALSLTVARMKGWRGNKLGLDRSVARVQRGRG